MIDLGDTVVQNVPSHYPASPVPARVAPQPWEDLPSLIIRTAAEMNYRKPQWIIRPQEADEEIEASNLCLLEKAADYRILQRLLALNEEALYNCTDHRFAARLCSLEKMAEAMGQRLMKDAGRIQRPLLGHVNTPVGFQPYSSARVCPRCLNEGTAYGRLYWNFTVLVMCPLHNIFLICRCPDCHKRIPLMRPSVTHCPHCKSGDYRKAQGVVASEGAFFHLGQKLIMHHLTEENMKQDSDIALLAGSPLLELAPWDYFLLLSAFLSTLPALFPDDPFLQAVPENRSQLRRNTEMRSPFTLREWVVLTATFHYIFVSWPKHFFAFLDVLIRNRRGQRVVGYEWRDLGPIGYKWIYKNLSDPTFLFLREAYEDYLRTRYIGESRIPAAERYSVSIAQVRNVLGVFPGEVDSLIDQRLLRVARGPVRVQNKTLKMRIERESMERLCREWEGLLPYCRVASQLNAGWDTMRMLREKGWLNPKRSPDIDGYPVELYSTTDIDAFSAALLSKAITTPHVAGESITLCALSTSGMAVIDDVLDAIFDGQLIPADTGTAKPLFQRLALSHTQIQHWQKAPKAESEECVLLTQEAVAKVLGIRKHVVTHLVQCKLLIEEGRDDLLHPLFHRERIEAFRQTYVFMREAAALLGVYPGTALKYIDERKIQPVLSGNVVLLFRREDIRSLLLDGLSV